MGCRRSISVSGLALGVASAGSYLKAGLVGPPIGSYVWQIDLTNGDGYITVNDVHDFLIGCIGGGKLTVLGLDTAATATLGGAILPATPAGFFKLSGKKVPYYNT